MGLFSVIFEIMATIIETLNRMKYFVYLLVVIYTENKILKLFHKILNKKTNKS